MASVYKHNMLVKFNIVPKKPFDPLTPRVKPCVIKSFPTFDSVDRTLKCHHSLESCWAVLFLKFYPVCNCGKFINFGLGAVTSKRVKNINNVFMCVCVYVWMCVCLPVCMWQLVTKTSCTWDLEFEISIWTFVIAILLYFEAWRLRTMICGL